MPSLKYPCPTKIISANQAEERVHQRNPSWVVAFVRFEEPASIYSGPDLNLQKTAENITVIENDCISVNITNNKKSFGKQCDLTMKVGEIYYPNLVAPGDWVFVWMSDYQDDMDAIARLLLSNSNGGGKLNSWDSGLKFIGRIIEIGDVQSVSPSGHVTLTQSIVCQGFLEFATSVFHTHMSKLLVAPTDTLPETSTDSTAVAQSRAELKDFQSRALIDKSVKKFVPDIDEKFKALYDSSKAFSSPDKIIEIFFILVFGVDKASLNAGGNIRGAFSDAIRIPKQVAMILDVEADKLWELYQVYLGIQRYERSSTNRPWEDFSPILADSSGSTTVDVFFETPDRCTGAVPFMPPGWDGKSAWALLSQYVNSPFNEMFTSFRCGHDNGIFPTLTVREVPFGTNLYDRLEVGKYSPLSSIVKSVKTTETLASNGKPTIQSPSEQGSIESRVDTEVVVEATAKPVVSDKKWVRAMYENLPRWIIDLSMVESINVRTSESERLNMVQVYAKTPGVEYLYTPEFSDHLRASQHASGNFVVDDTDISRHGLRMNVIESPYGDPAFGGPGSPALVAHWAKMLADHHFNGHLKPFGTITLKGIQEPICEGDNVQVNGVVYHIEQVHHSGSIGADGRKSFQTTLAVSNGILASSLTGDPKKMPVYPVHRSSVLRTDLDLPAGVTDIQRTAKKNRTEDGEVK